MNAVNRAQQAYYTEHKQFGSSFEEMEIPIGSPKYYTFDIFTGDYQSLAIARGIDNQKNGTRDYIAGVNYNQKT